MKPELSLLWLVLWFVLYGLRLKFLNVKHVFPHTMFFSAWVLYWAILYWAFAIYYYFSNKNKDKLSMYVLRWANPAVALLFALSHQIYLFLHICLYCPSKKRPKFFIEWFMTAAVMKAIPLYFALQYLVSWKESFLSSILVGFVYFIRAKMNHTKLVNVYVRPNNFYTAKYSGLGEGGIRGFSGEIPLESRRQNVHDLSSDTIESNTDFLNAVTTALMTPPDKTTDMNSIYKLEVQIANIQTENARKLLSEMGNPNVSKKPRSFLQYMNWYGINCPIDSNICVNVV